MGAQEDAVDKLVQARTAVYDLYFEKKIDIDQLYTQLLYLAKGWVEIDDKQEARDLIAEVSEEFLQERLPRLMRQSTFIHQAIVTLAKAFGQEDLGDAEELEIDLALLRGPKAQA
jgi:hypothetical protein